MKSGVRASRMSAAFISTLRRALGPMADHLGKAAAAASQAALASATVAAAATVATSSVTGSRRSKVAPPVAATRLPPIRRSTFVMILLPMALSFRPGGGTGLDQSFL